MSKDNFTRDEIMQYLAQAQIDPDGCQTSADYQLGYLLARLNIEVVSV